MTPKKDPPYTAYPRDESEMSLAQLRQEIRDLGPEPSSPTARGEWRDDMNRVRDEIRSRTSGNATLNAPSLSRSMKGS